MSSPDRQLTSAARERAAANALGSVRAEGLDPSAVEPVLRAWARGEITSDQMIEAGQAIAVGEHRAPSHRPPDGPGARAARG